MFTDGIIPAPRLTVATRRIVAGFGACADVEVRALLESLRKAQAVHGRAVADIKGISRKLDEELSHRWSLRRTRPAPSARSVAARLGESMSRLRYLQFALNNARTTAVALDGRITRIRNRIEEISTLAVEAA